METSPTLAGSWEKITDLPCAQVYPQFIEFWPNGLYAGTGAQWGNVPGWDRGTWRVISDDEVLISTMNDAILAYRFSLVDDVLTFVDREGCEFSYRRLPELGEPAGGRPEAPGDWPAMLE